jgi:uncharacterized membrane protein
VSVRAPSGVIHLALMLLLPLTFWVCHLQQWPLWWAGVPIILLAFFKWRRNAWIAAGLACFFAAWALFARHDLPVRLYPAAVNFSMLALFGLSLVRPPSMIERFAKLREPDLPPEGVAYCHKITIAWMIFFVLNGAVALWTALLASERVWAIYNGGIAYGLIGAMFGAEFLLRIRMKRRVLKMKNEDGNG